MQHNFGEVENSQIQIILRVDSLEVAKGVDPPHFSELARFLRHFRKISISSNSISDKLITSTAVSWGGCSHVPPLTLLVRQGPKSAAILSAPQSSVCYRL